MARTEIICPFCQKPQQLPDKKLYEPWRCMHCAGTIDDPFLHKKKSAPPKLTIPLRGKIISASGITNLSEIVATSEEYTKGFNPSTVMIPGSFELSAHMPASAPEPVHSRGSGLLVYLIFFLIVGGGAAAFVWFVIVPMTR